MSHPQQPNGTMILASLIILLLGLTGCLSLSITRDPFYRTFLEKTRLIMTEEELDIYLRLPDRESKLQFIEEFWKMRDPDPTTDENENKIEFERRLAFADRWFDVSGGCSGKEVPRGESYRRWGWNTDRGRVFVVMGPPDQVCYSVDSTASWQPVDPEDGHGLCRAAAWRYIYYRGAFYFDLDSAIRPTSPDSGTTALPAPDESYFSQVSTNSEIMNRAKLDMVSWAWRDSGGPRFEFAVGYVPGGLEVRIPIKAVSFVAKEGKLAVDFSWRVIVYREGKKVDDLRAEKSVALSEEEALKLKRVEFIIPYAAPGRGAYLFDVIVGYSDSAGVHRTRNYLKKTF